VRRLRDPYLQPAGRAVRGVPWAPVLHHIWPVHGQEVRHWQCPPLQLRRGVFNGLVQRLLQGVPAYPAQSYLPKREVLQCKVLLGGFGGQLLRHHEDAWDPLHKQCCVRLGRVLGLVYLRHSSGPPGVSQPVSASAGAARGWSLSHNSAPNTLRRTPALAEDMCRTHV
jgi:hypothetical protein